MQFRVTIPAGPFVVRISLPEERSAFRMWVMAHALSTARRAVVLPLVEQRPADDAPWTVIPNPVEIQDDYETNPAPGAPFRLVVRASTPEQDHYIYLSDEFSARRAYCAGSNFAELMGSGHDIPHLERLTEAADYVRVTDPMAIVDLEMRAIVTSLNERIYQ